MAAKYKLVSIVVPVFNEKKTIRRVVDKILHADTHGLAKEIIIVDDGSKDGTDRELLTIVSRHKKNNIRLLLKTQNEGKGMSLRKGFAMARGEIIIVQDADLEYDPAEYTKLLEPIIKGKTQVVYGSRMLERGKMRHGGLMFYVGGQFINWLTNYLYNLNLTDEATGYKVFKREILERIELSCRRFEFCPEFTAKLALAKIAILEKPIEYKGRTVAQGKKIRPIDGAEAIWTLLKYRMLSN